MVNGKIQAFPWDHWREEISLAEQFKFPLMEWTLDFDRWDENPLMSLSGRREIRLLSGRSGVRILSLTGDCFMQAPFFKTEGRKRALLIEDLQRIVKACGEMHIRYLIFPLVDKGRIENEQQQRVLEDELLHLASFLKKEGVQILFESDFSPVKLKRFIGSLPTEVFGINYDIGNSASLGFNPVEEIEGYGARIRNVHVKDRLLNGSTVPLGKGNADFPLVFSSLKKLDYKGNYILQTARAINGDHAFALCAYRDKVEEWLKYP